MTRFQSLPQINSGNSTVNVVRGLGATELGGVANALESVGRAVLAVDARRQRMIEAREISQHERQLIEKEGKLRIEANNADPAQAEDVYDVGMATLGDEFSKIENERVKTAVLGRFARRAAAGGIAVKETSDRRLKVASFTEYTKANDASIKALTDTSPESISLLEEEIEERTRRAVNTGTIREDQVGAVMQANRDAIEDRVKVLAQAGLSGMEEAIVASAGVADRGVDVAEELTAAENVIQSAVSRGVIDEKEGQRRTENVRNRVESALRKNLRFEEVRVAQALEAGFVGRAEEIVQETKESGLYVSQIPSTQETFDLTVKAMELAVAGGASKADLADQYNAALRDGQSVPATKEVQRAAYKQHVNVNRGDRVDWMVAHLGTGHGLIKDFEDGFTDQFYSGSEDSIAGAAFDLRRFHEAMPDAAEAMAERIGPIARVAMMMGDESDYKILANPQSQKHLDNLKGHLLGADDEKPIEQAEHLERAFGDDVVLNATQRRRLEDHYYLLGLTGAVSRGQSTEGDFGKPLANAAMAQAAIEYAKSTNRVRNRVAPKWVIGGGALEVSLTAAEQAMRGLDVPGQGEAGLMGFGFTRLGYQHIFFPSGPEARPDLAVPSVGGEVFIPTLREDTFTGEPDAWIRWTGSEAHIVDDRERIISLNQSFASRRLTPVDVLNQAHVNNYGDGEALSSHPLTMRFFAVIADARAQSADIFQDDPDYKGYTDAVLADLKRRYKWKLDVPEPSAP